MPTLPSAPRSPSTATAVAAYVEQLKAQTQATQVRRTGRLIFALDATASRQPTWDSACHLQGVLFDSAAGLGGLDVKLVYYGGIECKASRWLSSSADLHRVMRSVSCVGGYSQIERVLNHAITETRARKVDALLFVGDAMEEKVDLLCHLAGELGALGVPIFLFQEGNDPTAAAAFRQMATLSKGAYLRFDLAGIDRLEELLGAVAIFATGKRLALEAYGQKKGGEVLRLITQMKR